MEAYQTFCVFSPHLPLEPTLVAAYIHHFVNPLSHCSQRNQNPRSSLQCISLLHGRNVWAWSPMLAAPCFDPLVGLSSTAHPITSLEYTSPLKTGLMCFPVSNCRFHQFLLDVQHQRAMISTFMFTVFYRIFSYLHILIWATISTTIWMNVLADCWH
jgi:hypothetical protein